MNTATVSGGIRKSQAETPAARVATSSRERDSRTKVSDPAEQDGEGQHLLAQIGQLQDRHAHRDRGRDIVSGGAVQEIDDVDGEGQRQENGIDHRHAEPGTGRRDSDRESRTSSCGALATGGAPGARLGCSPSAPQWPRRCPARAADKRPTPSWDGAAPCPGCHSRRYAARWPPGWPWSGGRRCCRAGGARAPPPPRRSARRRCSKAAGTAGHGLRRRTGCGCGR